MAANGTAQRSWDIWSYVRPADGAENEVSDFCFTIYDPTTGQPEELKQSREIKTTLANVGPVAFQCHVSGSALVFDGFIDIDIYFNCIW